MDTERRITESILNAYVTGDFEPLFPLMTEDYEHLSFWVLEVKRGKTPAAEYYRGKGNAMRKSGSHPTGVIVKILEAPDRVRPHAVYQQGRRYLEPACFMHREDAGKLAVLLEQEVDGQTVRTLAIPTVTEAGMLRQLLITEPGFYRFTEAPDAGQ